MTTEERIREYAQKVAKSLPPLTKEEAIQVRHLLNLNAREVKKS